ncbi:MAG TPA: PAS domain S-box protein [Ignavibacteriaceae bacterium]|nr:PAS domain S-box protein [Ignavibacteriaceae bacterium]
MLNEVEKSTILIIENDFDMRTHISTLLSERYNTFSASNESEALGQIKEQRLDLVLIGIDIVGMDDLLLLRNIRTNSETKNLPVIMLTTEAGEETRVKLVEAGADAYLVKPFSSHELLTYIRVYLERSHLRIKAAVNKEMAQQEKTLHQTREHFYTLFNAIDEGFCIIEVLFNENNKAIDYLFVEVNSAFEKQSGIINALGKRMREVAPEHEEYWFEIYGNVALTGEPIRFENRAEQLHRWYDVYAFRIDPAEEHHVAVLFSDITWQKNNEEAIRNAKGQYDLLLNSMNEGFANYKAIYDEAGRLNDLLVLDINPAGAALTGVTREGQIGKRWKEVWTNIDDHLFDIYREIDKTGETYIFEHFSGITKRWYTNKIYKVAKDQFAATFFDITERKVDEEKIKIREAQFDAFFANSPAILNLVDENFCYINTDNLTPKYYGLDRDSIKGKCLQDLSLDFLQTTGQTMKRVIETGEPVLNAVFESPLPGKKGELAYWQTSFFRVPLGDEKWGVGVIGIEITDIKRYEMKLKESEERFRTLADNISQLAWMADENGNLFWYNKRWYDYTGTTFEEMNGWGWNKVHHPDHIERVIMNWTQALKDVKPWEDTFPLMSKEGEYKWFLSRALPIYDENGKIFRWFGTNTDITDHKKAEEDLSEAYLNIEESLKEKEILLREIYHRTKNTLQLISSMLSLRGSVIRNSEIQRIIEDMQDRIRAISLVHEKLYKGNNLSRINLKDYISSLASLLIQKYSMDSKITLKLDLEEIILLIDSAIPCGLIITELITNSIKHAFPGDMKGNIEIKLRRIENQIIELIISDNGIGLNDSDQNGDTNLGLQLFKSVAENQLDATTSLKVNQGVEWSIRFNDALYEERI